MREPDLQNRWRALAADRDSAPLVGVLKEEPPPPDMLQMIGDGVLAAVRGGVDGATDAAGLLIEALNERRWTGDRDLVDALEAAADSSAASSSLRPLTIDLEDIASVMEGDPVHGGGVIDLTTGLVSSDDYWEYNEDYTDEDREDPDRWLGVYCEGSRDGFRDMVRFIERLEDEELVDRLSRAIDGRGAFRAFKNELSYHDGMLSEFHAFTDDRQRGRAREWLASEGYTPIRRDT